MESERANGTTEHSRKASLTEQEIGTTFEEEAKAARYLTPSSSASSSCSSSSRASLEHDVSIAKSKSDGDLQRVQGSVSTPNGPNHTPEWSMMSGASPIVGFDGGHLSPITSPPVQTMGHPSDYDPDRIPCSVFSAKPANTSEWSVASNDSLFSIHVGNNSFTKDQFRSGELARLEESGNGHASEAKANELCSLPISLPPLMEVPSNEEGSAKSSNVSSFEKDDPTRGGTMPRLSNESGTSFAFPVLGSEGGKGGSLEKVEEKPEMEEHDTSGETPKPTGGWFSWCSCLPRCC